MTTTARRPPRFSSILPLLRLVTVLAATAACDESLTSATPTGGGSGGGGTGGGGNPGGGGTGATVGVTRFLAFGDSLTAGEVTAPVGRTIFTPTAIVPAAAYPQQLQDRLRARFLTQAGQIAVANAGRAEVVAASFPRLADLLANAQREAQVLLLLTGGEDLLNFGANGVASAAVALNELAREGRRRGLRVFIATVPPSIPGRQRSLSSDAVRAFNDQIGIIARGEGAVLVDVHAALSQDVGRYIGIDGWHPTEVGYSRIAEVFLASIATEFERR